MDRRFSNLYRIGTGGIRRLAKGHSATLWTSRSLQSDNGASFVPEITQYVVTALEFSYHLHNLWRSQSLGKVEMADYSLKKVF